MVLLALVASVGLLISVVFYLRQVARDTESLHDAVLDLHEEILEREGATPEANRNVGRNTVSKAKRRDE